MKHKNINYLVRIIIKIYLENYVLMHIITLKEHGNAKYDEITVIPGVFEIPVLISRNIEKYDGFVALGCVIKGETPHFDFISKQQLDAIMNLSITHKKPIGNGILTCLNYDQARLRAAANGKIRKGREAAQAVLDVLDTK